MIVEAGSSKDAADRLDRSAYDSAVAGWKVGLTGVIVGAATAASGSAILVLSRGEHDPHASGTSLWLSVGGANLRIGGTW
jgi:hypothetical protein